MGGVSSGSFGSAIHNGSQQRHSGFPVKTQSDLGVGVDPESRGFLRSAEEVDGVHRPVRNLTKSPMLPIFFSVPRSKRSGHGCSAPELECVAGVCLSSLVSHTGSTEEAPIVIWSPPDHHSSLLAPELLELVVDGPVPLPLSRDLLRQPHFHRHHLGVSGLSLHAWRLASDLPDRRVSPCT